MVVVDEGVGFLEIAAALAVSEDDVAGEQRAKHVRGDLARVGAARLGMHVLRAQLDDRALQ